MADKQDPPNEDRSVDVLQSPQVTNFAIPIFDDSNVKWNVWIKVLANRLISCNVPATQHATYLLSFVGFKSYEILSNLCYPSEPESKSFDELKNMMSRHLQPPSSEIVARYKFYSRYQNATESITDFVAALKELTVHCKFGGSTSDEAIGNGASNMLDEALRDRLICGLKSDAIREKLLSEDTLNFSRAVEIAKFMEVVVAGAAGVMESQRAEGGTVNKISSANEEESTSCTRYGENGRTKMQCRHIKSSCFRCKKIGHLQSVCKSKNKKENKLRKRKEGNVQHMIVESEEEKEDNASRSEATFCYTVNNFSKMKGSQLSPPFYVRNLPWRIKIMPRNSQGQRFLGFWVQCDGDSGTASWNCYTVASLRLLSNREGQEPYARKIEHNFCSKEYDWGFSSFIRWQDVLDVDEGYIKDDTITLEVHIIGDAPRGLSQDS